MPPPAVSALAGQTISSAFQELEKAITPGDAHNFSSITLRKVQAEVLKIENEFGALRKVVDVLCNGTPFLPWVWAPITLILRIASDHLEAFEHIIKAYSRIAECLKRFAVLSNSFPGTRDFQETVAVFYADILEFHKHAYQFVRRSSWKLLFVTSWHRFQRRFDNIIDDMRRHEELIDKEANTHHIAKAQQMQQEIRAWRGECTEQLQRSEEEHGIKQYNLIVSWLKVDDSDQTNIFHTLLEESTKYPGTCSWVLQNKKMAMTLQRKPDVPVLWVQGAAGTGKSVLSSSMVNFMNHDGTGRLVLSHFCNHTYPSSTKYDFILRSLLLQLVRKDGDLAAHVYGKYVLDKKVPSIPVMERLLHLLLSSISKGPRQACYVWIVFDGIDECDPQTQSKVFSLISQVTSRASSPDEIICKALLSCRFSPTASARLRKKQSISLSEEKGHLNNSIRLYANHRLKSIYGKFQELNLNGSDIKDIEDAVTEKADGMFLYARLVLDYLSNNIQFSGEEIKYSAQELPPKLSELSSFAWIVEERPDSRLVFIHVSVQEFLQSSSSNLILMKKDCLLQHGIATITCLLAGIKAFKGLHCFHIYSKEHWTDYLLSVAPSLEEHDASASAFLNLAEEFAVKLNQLQDSDPKTTKLVDERIATLHSLPLRMVVNRCLKARSEEELKHKSQQMEARGKSDRTTAITAIPPPQEGASLVLQRYQATLRYLLSQNILPGITAAEMDTFKREFRASAYTCRVRGCPRATEGFEREAQCHEHETLHVRRLECTYSGCQALPFGSSNALERHIRKDHHSALQRTSIRGRTKPKAFMGSSEIPQLETHGGQRLTTGHAQPKLDPQPNLGGSNIRSNHPMAKTEHSILWDNRPELGGHIDLTPGISDPMGPIQLHSMPARASDPSRISEADLSLISDSYGYYARQEVFDPMETPLSASR
ncbi:uncharacterized protein PG986_008465 [Apiospora aurea]|uniref:C2H2-type domain-containing protein n=1 Tax=Apiospora aurea TaxID=335848 RepID=A0ABR1QFI2_9PEZI